MSMTLGSLGRGCSPEETTMMTTTTTTDKHVTIRARAFQGVLETLKCIVEPDGSVRVYDSVARYYTSCHSLSTRDLARIRAAAKRA